MKHGGGSKHRSTRLVRMTSFIVLLFAVLVGLWGLGSGLSTVPIYVTVLLIILLSGLALLLSDYTHEIDKSTLDKTREQVSLQHERTLTLINNLTSAILSIDNDGIITVYNAAALNLLDTNASPNGENIAKVVPLQTVDKQPFGWEKELASSKSVVVRDDLVFNEGDDQIRLEVTYSPIRSGYSSSSQSEIRGGYIIIMRDITKAKSLEEERDEFISVISHELRTPITIAEGTISNLQLMMERGISTPEKMSMAVNGAHDQIIFLASMVNDLATLSRAERGVADDAESIDIKSMANELYKEYSPQAEAKGLHFNLDLGHELGSVLASRLYLQELLQNFITNSIKYTKEGSVTLEISLKSKNLCFKVHDTGIGISKTDQAKIFDKFYRAEDYRTRETSGTGLGLYVAVKLARKLGTKISLSSRLNHGSTFCFTLPVEKTTE